MRTIYIADDGKQFDNCWDCEEYEFVLHNRTIEDITFIDEHGLILNLPDGYNIEDIIRITDKAYRVIIPDKRSLDALQNYCTEGIPCVYGQINSPGEWKFVLVDDGTHFGKETFVKVR